jgi:hypothetical protein
MPTEEDIERQKTLLQAHRKTLWVYLVQLARVGIANAKPEVFHGIDDAREGIRQSKKTLRSWGVAVEDEPDDEATPIKSPAIAISPGDLIFQDREPVYSLFTENPFPLGSTDDRRFEYPLLPELEDCSVECEIRIDDDNDAPNNWAGFRVRGFRAELDHVGFCYLTNLRPFGTVELML